MSQHLNQDKENQEQPQVLPEHIQALARQNAQMDQRMKDSARFLAGDQPPMQPNPQQQLQNFLTHDPAGYANWVVNQAVHAATAQAAQIVNASQKNAGLVDEFKQANPHLAPFQEEITLRANQLAENAQRTGQPIDPRGLIQQAVNEYNQKLQHYSNTSKQQQQQDAMKQNALKFEVSNTGQHTFTSLADALAWAGDDYKKFQQVKKAKQAGLLK